jgi:hypothetical protein
MSLFYVKPVGVTGFEPAASSSRTTRATKLRYTPIHRLANVQSFGKMPNARLKNLSIPDPFILNIKVLVLQQRSCSFEKYLCKFE